MIPLSFIPSRASERERERERERGDNHCEFRKREEITAVTFKLDQLDHVKGCDALDPTSGNQRSQGARRLKLMGCDEKKAAVHAEIERVNQLPSKSSYAMHRMRVLNKVLHLLSLQRTASQDEDLELLFAGLSL